MLREEARLLRDQLGQSVEREEADLLDLHAEPQRPARRAAQEPDIKPARAPTRADVEDPLDLGDEPGLFTDLSHDRLRGCFVRTKMPLGPHGAKGR